jgi:Zn-dependent M28 family amino/carboxypeptidase
MQTFRYDVITSSWWGDASWSIRWFEEQGYYDGLEWTDYSQNVILTLPGRSDETIVIGAHYDSVANEGISDNAAGVALLLETANRLQYYDHYYTLQFVFYGAEEVGLIGAFYFVDNLSETEVNNLILSINADVIVEGPVFVYALGSVAYLPDFPETLLWAGGDLPTIHTCSLTLEIDDIADKLLYHDIHLTAIPEAIFSPTDHLAFLEFGIPVMYIYGTYEPVYPEFFVRNILHTPDDNLDFIMGDAPGRIEDALYSFGRFLEEILLVETGSL